MSPWSSVCTSQVRGRGIPSSPRGLSKAEGQPAVSVSIPAFPHPCPLLPDRPPPRPGRLHPPRRPRGRHPSARARRGGSRLRNRRRCGDRLTRRDKSSSRRRGGDVCAAALGERDASPLHGVSAMGRRRGGRAPRNGHGEGSVHDRAPPWIGRRGGGGGGGACSRTTSAPIRPPPSCRLPELLRGRFATCRRRLPDAVRQISLIRAARRLYCST